MRLYNIFSSLLMSGLLVSFAACDKGDNGGDDGKDGEEGNYPPVTITEKPSGEVKAGYTDGVTIIGEGFDEVQDYIYVGWDENGTMEYERISDASLEFRSTRVSFGFNVGARFLDKTVTVYLDRPGYDRMPISDPLTIALPEVSEGYIPDAAFRAVLKTQNPSVATLFNACDLLDVQGAAALKNCGNESGYGLDLGGSSITSLEGIELFSGVSGVIAIWYCPNIKEIDLSNWKAKNISVRLDGDTALESFTAAPFEVDVYANDCPNLKTLNASTSRWMSSIQCTGSTELNNLDLRKDMNGTWKDKNMLTDDEDYTLYGGDCFFPLTADAKVKIDSWFLFDHNVNNGSASDPSCWTDIYNAWTRGATIEVYSWVDIDYYIATAPSYAEDPEALSPNNKIADYVPSNKWQVDDPLTEENEAPNPYNPSK